MPMDPTSKGDMQADLLRRWYESNRETLWDRHRPGADRKHLHADEWAIRLMNEAHRIGGLTDGEIYSAYNLSVVQS